MTNERIIELFEIATHKKIDGGDEVAQVNLDYMKTVVRSYVEDKVEHFKYVAAKAAKARDYDYSLANQRLADGWQSVLDMMEV